MAVPGSETILTFDHQATSGFADAKPAFFVCERAGIGLAHRYLLGQNLQGWPISVNRNHITIVLQIGSLIGFAAVRDLLVGRVAHGDNVQLEDDFPAA